MLLVALSFSPKAEASPSGSLTASWVPESWGGLSEDGLAESVRREAWEGAFAEGPWRSGAFKRFERTHESSCIFVVGIVQQVFIMIACKQVP